MDVVIGRDDELAQVEQFLGAGSSSVLVVEGEAGIGKTTVWEASAAKASERGFRLLSCRPAEAEAKLSFSGLADLLGEIESEAFEELPLPQRRALEAALLRVETASTRPDRRSVATGFASLLKLLASNGPLLVAVDDLQWLDAPSAAALAFALRRVGDSPVRGLLSLRVPVPDENRVLVPEAARRLTLGPLSAGALQQVIKAELGFALSRPALLRLHRACRGNAFYSLEIARVLASEGPLSGDVLPVPDDVRELTMRRVRRLPSRTRSALLEAAALANPTVRFVEVSALKRAVEAGLVQIHPDGAVGFVHPLYASAVYTAVSPDERRKCHRKLADRVSDLEERARHLGLAAEGPDEDIAAALEAASDRALAQGAEEAAAELMEQACALTPIADEQGRLRRRLAVAHRNFLVGDSRRAREAADAVFAESPPGDLRAEALLLLGDLVTRDAEGRQAVPCLERALGGAQDPLLKGRIHWALARAWQDHDLGRSVKHARAAVEAVDPEQAPGTYAYVLLFRVWTELLAGLGFDERSYGRALELQPRAVGWEESTLAALLPRLKDELDTARRRLREQAERREETGRSLLLLHLADLELSAGNLDPARAIAAEVAQLADDLGQRDFQRMACCVQAMVEAQLGRLDEAQALAEEVRRAAGEEPWVQAEALAVLGFCAVSLDDAVAADGHFSRATALLDATGLKEPAAFFRFQPDHVETVLALSDQVRADALVSRLGERAEVFPRPWTLAVAARCRGLVLAAQGQADQALEVLDRALDAHEQLDMPFELARTLLARGVVERRARRKSAAKASLEQAAAIFESLPAPLWAEKARSEHGRIGLRPRAPAELTPSELRIAGLVVSGLSNREVAAAAYVSRKTVEANLTRIYRKLGIRSRAELGAWLARRGSL